MKKFFYQKAKLLSVVLMLVLPLFATVFIQMSASASSDDYSMVGQDILNTDATATIQLVSSKTNTYYGMTLEFPTSLGGSIGYFTLNSFTPADGITPSTVDVNNGTVYWADLTLTGQSVEAGQPIISATYNVHSRVRGGNYSFPVYVSAINTDVDDEDFTLTAVVHVERVLPDYELEISGVAAQEVVYTGSPVVLNGNPTVAANDFGIKASDLNTTWYATDGDTEIERPTNVGSYVVAYDYFDDDCWGELIVEFSIVKADSPAPAEMTAGLSVLAGSKLSEIDGTRSNGFNWNDPDTEVGKGAHTYPASYTHNNDADNYNAGSFNVPVYGLSKIKINVETEGEGGYVAGDLTDVLENTEIKITLTPATGHTVKKVLIDGVDATSKVKDNVLTFKACASDMNVQIIYTNIEYTFRIEGTNVQTDPSGVFKVHYGANQSVIIEVNRGYRLTSVKVNGVEKISEVTNGKITINNIKEDTTVIAVAEQITYRVVEGDGQLVTPDNSDAVSFVVDVESDMFGDNSGVFIDGKLIDAENYEVSGEDKVIVKFKEEFVDTIEDGTHTVTIMMDDGGVATATITVEGILVPNTGMNTAEMNIVSKLILLPIILAVGAFLYFSVKGRPAKIKFNGE